MNLVGQRRARIEHAKQLLVEAHEGQTDVTLASVCEAVGVKPDTLRAYVGQINWQAHNLENFKARIVAKQAVENYNRLREEEL